MNQDFDSETVRRLWNWNPAAERECQHYTQLHIFVVVRDNLVHVSYDAHTVSELFDADHIATCPSVSPPF